MTTKGFGYCGLACDYCQDNQECRGCKQGGCPEKEICKNYQCCTTQNYQYCFECPDFPCEDSLLHKLRIRTFCYYIQQYGEDELARKLKENSDKGIQYHYKNQHVGDYDAFDTEEEIIQFIQSGIK